MCAATSATSAASWRRSWEFGWRVMGDALPVSERMRNAGSTQRVDVSRLRVRVTLAPVVELLPAKADAASRNESVRGPCRHHLLLASSGSLGLLVVHHQELAAVVLRCEEWCRVSGLCFVGTVSTRLNWIIRPYGRTTIDVLEGLNRKYPIL